MNHSLANRVRRTGIVLAGVLVSLLIVAALAVTLTQSVLLHHRQVRLSEQREQSFWLAESAMQRALHALGESSDYRGETWHVDAGILGAEANGVAEIQVTSTQQPEKGVWVRVEARYPDVPLRRIVHNRELFVPTASPGALP